MRYLHQRRKSQKIYKFPQKHIQNLKPRNCLLYHKNARLTVKLKLQLHNYAVEELVQYMLNTIPIWYIIKYSIYICI